jgi:hypothetical protein
VLWALPLQMIAACPVQSGGTTTPHSPSPETALARCRPTKPIVSLRDFPPTARAVPATGTQGRGPFGAASVGGVPSGDISRPPPSWLCPQRPLAERPFRGPASLFGEAVVLRARMTSAER